MPQITLTSVDLYQTGATKIVRNLFDNSLRAGRDVSGAIGLDAPDAPQADMLFYQHDGHTLTEQPKVWEPYMATNDNLMYQVCARSLGQRLKPALATMLDRRNNPET